MCIMMNHNDFSEKYLYKDAAYYVHIIDLFCYELTPNPVLQREMIT